MNQDLKYSELINFFEFVCKNYHVYITIKDCANFISAMDKELAAALVPYLSHNNGYCDFIKSDDSRHFLCLKMSGRIQEKLKKSGQTFFGICHAGVGEFIVPIIYESDQLLGFLTIGPYKVPEEIVNARIRRISRINHTNEDLTQKYYASLHRLEIPELSMVAALFEIAAQHISMIHHQNVLDGKYIRRKAGEGSTVKEEIMMNSALEYIQQNFKEDLCLRKISEYCHCSKSYISHIFKKITGLSLSEYTLRIRIKEAKKMLLASDQSITDIALAAGFNDSNYFTSAFKKLTHMTPNEFRKNYR